MQAPSFWGAWFLVYLLFLLPRGAFRSARLLRNAAHEGSDEQPFPSRYAILGSTVLILGLTFLLSWVTARDYGFEIFARAPLGLREILAGAGALALALSVNVLSYLSRTEEERRNMSVYALLPRTPGESALFATTALAAGVAEEAAYRGVAMVVLGSVFASPWPAIALSLTAFSLAHIVQGWKSVIAILLIAAGMHALVWFTGTLLVAMVVHVVYDLIASFIGVRHARGYERQAREQAEAESELAY